MARTNLGDLLGKLPDQDAPTQRGPEPETIPAQAPTPAKPPSPDRERTPRSRPAPAATDASYLEFVRKDTRLREDQLEALTVQARRLNRAKRNTGVRITENTLIRIAIDLLLDRIDHASGDDEDTLQRSLR